MVLDTITAEVSQKVKNAIKAKLNELGVYVDDELPDYIMILVGNRKTKEQMDDDLSLFLSHNTGRFTSWLHDVLERLNAASVLHKESKSSKEKKKEEDDDDDDNDEKVEEAEETKGVEEKKKHKKKKDKSEKKKEKKEKKKKKDKDKEKHSKSHKRKDEKSKSKSKSPAEEKIVEGAGDVVEAGNGSESSLKLFKNLENSSILNGSKITSTNEDANVINFKVSTRLREDELASDVVNLRPNAEDLALGLEDEPPTKKVKAKLVSKELKDKDQGLPDSTPPQTITSFEIQVDNPRAKEALSRSSSDDAIAEVSTSGVHERLALKRLINLREESTFPPKSIGGEGIGRVVSSAIASAVKSVTLGAGTKSEGKTGKRLEARVRPLVSSRIKPEEPIDDVALPPVRLVSTVGAVLKRSHSNDSDDNEEPPSKRITGVASKVEVTPRPRRPGALQANTALILRAVADAHKSVNKPSRKPIEEKEEDRVRKEIFTRSYQERQSHRLSSSDEGKAVKKFAITVPNALLKDNVEMKIAGKSTLGETYLDEIDMDDMEADKQETRIKSKILPQTKILATNKVIPMQVDETSGSTRFIVTLDGFGNEVPSTDLRTRIRGRAVRTPSVEEEEFVEEVEEWEEEVEEMEGVTPQAQTGSGLDRVTPVPAPKWKAKIDASDLVTKKEERCRYWPACKEGTACQYIHPSKTCNTFPNCRFGDKCVYVHPNCMFDGACTKLNCPFTHTVSRSLGLGNPATLKPKIPNPKLMVKCKFYPKCVDMNCPYMHPKQICRYGKSCQTPSCLFVHPEVTTGSLLKWKAPKAADKGSPTASSKTTSTVV